MATQEKTGTFGGIASVIILVLGGVVWTVSNGALGEGSPQRPSAKTSRPSHTINMYVVWYADRIPDDRLGEVTISWSLGEAHGSETPTLSKLERGDVEQRSWSLSRHARSSHRSLVYDGVSSAHIEADTPADETVCIISVDGRTVASDHGKHPVCDYPVG